MTEPSDDEYHWDPTDAGRVYYRHKQTGNLGWLVVREGKKMIRLDRPQEEILFPLKLNADGDSSDWVKEGRPKMFGPGVAARISFEAYKALCSVTGRPNRAKMEWASVSDEMRADFIKSGPRGGSPLEKSLHRAIMSVLERES